MNWLAGMLNCIRTYAAHPDPLTAASNRVALLVASNQPLYPLYLWWLVGGDWPVSFLTWLSTPLFCAVPALARRWPSAGPALLVGAGVANGMLSAKAFGVQSGVATFLIPCALIAALGFRAQQWRWSIALLALVAAAAAVHGIYGNAWGQFDAPAYRHFLRFNLWSVLVLTLYVGWTLGRARSAPDRSA